MQVGFWQLTLFVAEGTSAVFFFCVFLYSVLHVSMLFISFYCKWPYVHLHGRKVGHKINIYISIIHPLE